MKQIIIACFFDVCPATVPSRFIKSDPFNPDKIEPFHKSVIRYDRSYLI